MYLPCVSPFLSSPPSVSLYLAASSFFPLSPPPPFILLLSLSITLHPSFLVSICCLPSCSFSPNAYERAYTPGGIVTLSLFLSPSVSLLWISRPSYLPISSTYLLQATLNAGLARDNPRPSPPPATAATSSHSLSGLLFPPPPPPRRCTPSLVGFARPLPHHTPPLRVSPFSLLVDGTYPDSQAANQHASRLNPRST